MLKISYGLSAMFKKEHQTVRQANKTRRINKRMIITMAEYTNSISNSNGWELYFKSSPYGECLVILIILFYGLKIQLQKLSHQRNINLIKEFKRKVVHMLVTLLNWCAYMQDYDDDVIEKHVISTKVIPYENKTIIKPERRGKANTLGILPRKLWQNKDKLPWQLNGQFFL